MTRLPVVVGTVALTALLLTACGAGGPSLPGVPDGSGPTTSTDDGGDDTDMVQNQVPETFPDDVPLIGGDVLFAVDLGTGWTVIFASDDPLADFDTVIGQLEDAGFEVATQDANDEQAFAQLTSEKYTINLSAADDPTYGDVISYTVVLT